MKNKCWTSAVSVRERDRSFFSTEQFSWDFFNDFQWYGSTEGEGGGERGGGLLACSYCWQLETFILILSNPSDSLATIPFTANRILSLIISRSLLQPIRIFKSHTSLANQILTYPGALIFLPHIFRQSYSYHIYVLYWCSHILTTHPSVQFVHE